MTDPNDIELAAVRKFFALGFADDFAPGKIGKAEAGVVERAVEYVSSRFGHLAYVLGLALDFTMVAQRLSQFDPAAKVFRPGLDEAGLLAAYPPTTSETKNVNTLTLTFRHEGKLKKVGIRAIEEKVCDLFVATDRSGYPSAASSDGQRNID